MIERSLHALTQFAGEAVEAILEQGYQITKPPTDENDGRDIFEKQTRTD